MARVHVSSGAHGGNQVVRVSLDSEVDVRVEGARLEVVVFPRAIVVQLIIPSLNESFIVSHMADLVVIEAVAIEKSVHGSNKKTRLPVVSVYRIKSIRHLSNQISSPCGVSFVPLVVVAGGTPGISNEKHLKNSSVRVGHLKSRNDSVSVGLGDSTLIGHLVITTTSSGYTHNISSIVSGLEPVKGCGHLSSVSNSRSSIGENRDAS